MLNIFTRFIEDGAPVTGLSPLVTIKNISTSTDTGPFEMTDIGDGLYQYTLTKFDALQDYVFLVDGVADGSSRYQTQVWNGYESLISLIPRSKGGGGIINISTNDHNKIMEAMTLAVQSVPIPVDAVIAEVQRSREDLSRLISSREVPVDTSIFELQTSLVGMVGSLHGAFLEMNKSLSGTKNTDIEFLVESLNEELTKKLDVFKKKIKEDLAEVSLKSLDKFDKYLKR